MKLVSWKMINNKKGKIVLKLGNRFAVIYTTSYEETIEKASKLKEGLYAV